MRILPVLLLLPVLSFGGEINGHELGWLVGCWVTPDGSAQEVWIVDREGALAGFGVVMVDNKVKFYELLSIRRNADDSLVYTAHPAGQAPASFTEKEITENSVLFANADHDFPQEIKYTRASDRLHATISLLDGADATSFHKVSCEQVTGETRSTRTGPFQMQSFNVAALEILRTVESMHFLAIAILATRTQTGGCLYYG